MKYLKEEVKKEDLNMSARSRKIGTAKSEESGRVDCVELKRKPRREIVFKWPNSKIAV